MPIISLHDWYLQKNRKEFNPMHWTERRRARVNLALGLQARGWTLYGFKEDQSDSMTDYYDPASWDGIAEKGGYVVVVDVSAGSALLKRSGGYETTKRVPGDDCPHCGDSGKEPEGWTLEDARANPREFNRSWAKGGQALLPDVVSPLLFDSDGNQKCTRCHGQGHAWKLEEVTVDWPSFGSNPARRLWHVAKDGRILASGIGLGPCADWDREKAQAAVERIVKRIEAAIQARHVGIATVTDPAVAHGVVIRRNLARNGIEVVFPAKPDAETRRRLGSKKKGGLGFRWSKRQGLWYARYSPTLWKQVHELLAITDDPPDQDATEADEIANPLLDAAIEALTAQEPEPSPTPAIPPDRTVPSQPTQIALF